ncbi:MAG: DUF2283 domain-containing protein [Candidatus Baldrarchaeia archaeon]
MEEKYGLTFPRKVIKIDLDEDRNVLYIEFKRVKFKEGEPTEDGEIIIYYDNKGEITALEIVYLNDVLQRFLQNT